MDRDRSHRDGAAGGARQGRRAVLAGGAAALLLARLPAARAGGLVPVPAMTEGPFYPPELPADADGDLVRVTGRAAEALGQVTHLAGRVLRTDGSPVPQALVEIWQCDANGRYLHPRSGGSAPRDDGFQGFGRVLAGADGSYAFRTIRPVPYPGRTPHIHVAVRLPGGVLVTQMFVEGEPGNARDFLYRRLDSRQRAAVTVRLEPAEGIEPGALAGRFDLVLPPA